MSLEDIERLISVQPTEKTLLLVDHSKDEDTLRAFQNTGEYVVIDAEKMHMKKSIQKMKVPLILEEARFLLVFAMKYGKTVVVRFGKSSADLRGTFCDECCPGLVTSSKQMPGIQLSYLPSCFLLQGGRVLREGPLPTGSDFVSRLFRRDDILELEEEDLPVECHPAFRVVVTSALDPDKIEDSLLNGRFGLPGKVDDYQFVQYEPTEYGSKIDVHS